MCRLMFFIKYGMFSAMISLNSLSAPLSFLSDSGILSMHAGTSRCPKDLQGSGHSSSVFFLSFTLDNLN